ncbi:electron transfer flavoprotein subunit alpha/FixB family protein [Marinomonas algarum]|uniref:Electron transfer flavoprotein subunit alpha n=1 Tax=Marinomonas algarum TaxID=2883105 RepID=A0A9X1LE90_9GAMM|nr:FAD-binding protein [Marinomonas algarum]MCB5160735.1 FAD-binding protein [Marinomonas algarum]
MKTLIIAEHNQHALKAETLVTLGAAQQLGQPIDLFIAGHDIAQLGQDASSISGIDRVLTWDNEALTLPFSETLAPVIASLRSQYSHILLATSSFGKDLAPRIAALCNVNAVSDVIEIISPNQYKRPIYAGNAIATVKNNATCQVLTIRTSAFTSPNHNPTASPAQIQALSIELPMPSVNFVKQTLSESNRPELSGADIIVSGGRAIGSESNFSIIYDLADKLGAAVGASRAAVDAGYIANDLQVGQTGKVVAPSVYIAIGISGAIQHLAGMKDSKVIVAINNDPDAPIFSVADYGLVADLFEAVPAMTADL